MRKHALVKDNTVIEVQTLTEEQVAQKSLEFQLVVDIHDLLVQPEVGWVLSGNTLIPPSSQVPSLQTLIKAKIKSYQHMASELLVDLYVENTLLGITTQQSDQMFEEFEDVLMRIREGAWPTALYRLSQKQPNGFVTQEMINRWSELISSRML